MIFLPCREESVEVVGDGIGHTLRYVGFVGHQRLGYILKEMKIPQ